MSSFATLRAVYAAWIDAVACTADAALARYETHRRVRMVEEEDGSFALRLADPDPGWRGRERQDRRKDGDTSAPLPDHRLRLTGEGVEDTLPPAWSAALRGSRVELVLRPSRFLFCPLELPKRAGEFLDGIVRAQIDRLTPWSPTDAAYHWTRPREQAGERITLTVVATARAVVAPLAQAVAGLGAAAVAVSTDGPEGDAVTVYETRAHGADRRDRVRSGLHVAFVACGLAALVTMTAAGFVADHYDAQTQQLQQRIAERRAAIRAGQGGGSSAQGLLERRKHATPASVMALEALSALLPDHTYATELRIEDDRLQIVGITRDAPSLIQILEQSPHFGRATFFAPTTRAENDPGERFHVEARMRPHFKLEP
ncbi:PilN domain-containing protein [Blastochloris sulfoviridis]|uniref:PilN domain-containing protein n=1 Tax=Blastochloris sulfoviridis TaxID=50712 RepID=A0A5M6I773_9HYPH|nr:PilN domain-containing protein [Blastochloris sulfoviridis]KAA5603685.1 PilN domain-containing protein [Blastochloris sulfoviridis]